MFGCDSNTSHGSHVKGFLGTGVSLLLSLGKEDPVVGFGLTASQVV